jgi:RNA recognition motif-containing protein
MREMTIDHSTRSNNSVLVVDGSNSMRPKRSSPAANPPTRRGPPTKPHKTEHALWVGNLPPSIDVHDLKEHFSQGATEDIQSVFLISQSNCAFVNYRSATSCVDALTRFHGSQLRFSRLVCRLRTGLEISELQKRSPGPRKHNSIWPTESPGNEAYGPTACQPKLEIHPPENRYFIVKSLTIEDLETSRDTGIWATQPHNEMPLRKAYDTSKNVYLIFSANKSGEYFGYARMSSSMTDDGDLSRTVPLRTQYTLAKTELNMAPTLATSTAPAGIIVRDLGRGTVFWEVRPPGNHSGCNGIEYEQAAWPEFSSLGTPFGVEWVSTNRVLFDRTRDLRNPWNANREVKIARDGTELEPSVGRKLIQLFHSI